MKISNLIFGLCLLVGSPVQAAESYVLALSWQPQFCEEAGRKKPECKIQQGTYFASKLVLHGLWPQGGEYCGIEAGQIADDKAGRWEKLPALPLSPATAEALSDLMPGRQSHLDRHEWVKHGTCSGLDPETYFSHAITLVRQVNERPLAQLIGSNAGRKIPATDLCRITAQDFGSDGLPAVSLKTTKKDELQEVRIFLRRTDRLEIAPGPFDKMACRGVGGRQISIDAAN
jgi:ribonuclease T2